MFLLSSFPSLDSPGLPWYTQLASRAAVYPTVCPLSGCRAILVSFILQSIHFLSQNLPTHCILCRKSWFTQLTQSPSRNQSVGLQADQGLIQKGSLNTYVSRAESPQGPPLSVFTLGRQTCKQLKTAGPFFTLNR